MRDIGDMPRKSQAHSDEKRSVSPESKVRLGACKVDMAAVEALEGVISEDP